MPSNADMRGIIEEIMAEDSMTMELFRSHAQLVTTSATGSYRKIVARAEQIVFDIAEIQNTNQDLLTPNYLVEPDPTPELKEGDEFGTITKALRIKFSLKPSSYATMFLREVTRTSSAFSVQHKIS